MLAGTDDGEAELVAFVPWIVNWGLLLPESPNTAGEMRESWA